MKVSTIIIASVLVMAPFQSTIAAPAYRDNCPSGVSCVDHKPDAPLIGINLSRELSRKSSSEIQTSSLLGGIPILGPILGPILQALLGAISTLEADGSSSSAQSLPADQLANLESLLLNAAQGITSSSPASAAPVTRALQVRGTLSDLLALLGSIIAPLLDLSVGTASDAISSLSLDGDQSEKLAQLKSILEQSLSEITPQADDTSPSPSATPSDADAPDATPTPSDLANDDDDDDDSTPTTSTVVASPSA